MLPRPTKIKLVSGSGEGEEKLSAFDRALLDAGIGNLNLIRVSSILPPGCLYEEEFPIPPGSLTPTAYGSLISDEAGREISAAVGIGFSRSAGDYGVIMEFAGFCSREEAARRVTEMVREAFRARGKELLEVKVTAVSRRVDSRPAAVVAAAVMWY